MKVATNIRLVSGKNWCSRSDVKGQGHLDSIYGNILNVISLYLLHLPLLNIHYVTGKNLKCFQIWSQSKGQGHWEFTYCI